MTQITIVQQIKDLALKFYPEVVKIRRHLHMHPELSFEEYKTSEYICSVLTSAGIPYRSGFVKTGIVGKIEGRNPGSRTIALRAELDALPIKEETDKAFKSVNEGVMHACGHDAHASSLLGTAMILNDLRDSFEGTVLLIFQPGEEKAPGGARLMLEEGALSDPEPELIIAQHVLPSLEAGKLGFKEGIYMASSDEIYIEIGGKGGHAALPHETTDIVLVASHIIVALQQIVSRQAEASTPTVLSFGKFIAPGAVNVIPSTVTIEGTFRTMDESWRKEAHKRMTNIARSIAESMGASCSLRIVPGYPVLNNDPGATRKVRMAAATYLGEENISDLGIRMTAEDFAFYSLKYPAVLYRLGIKNEDKFSNSQLHTPEFDIDEDALLTGMGSMAYIACSYLQADDDDQE